MEDNSQGNYAAGVGGAVVGGGAVSGSSLLRNSRRADKAALQIDKGVQRTSKINAIMADPLEKNRIRLLYRDAKAKIEKLVGDPGLREGVKRELASNGPEWKESVFRTKLKGKQSGPFHNASGKVQKALESAVKRSVPGLIQTWAPYTNFRNENVVPRKMLLLERGALSLEKNELTALVNALKKVRLRNALIGGGIGLVGGALAGLGAKKLYEY